MVKTEQIKKTQEIIKEAELALSKDVLDKQDIERIAQQVDNLLAEMGTYRRFFKRLS